MDMAMDSIAIIGLSFRLPQSADNESSFWEMLEGKRNAMTTWPKSRANIDAFYHPTENNTLHSKGAHFLTEDPGVFDAPFFSITTKEANSMDPQQRWLLETSYHALENAGIPAEKLIGSETGVFAASMASDYFRVLAKDPDEAPVTAATGTAESILANRLSWYYDLKGPSLQVNTACSSSMIAMDLACQSLHGGQSSLALVAGSNALLNPELSLYQSNMGFLSPDSVCYSFDERANGYARGEGYIVLVLKKLSDAVRDGDIIRAVIRGTGSNQDGHTPGLTVPSAASQEDLIRSVYNKSNIDFGLTRYVEAHGTGTVVGDSTEVKSLGRVFRSSRSRDAPLYIGSVKANIGHLEGCSGLAGILKCIMILEKGIIPPNALFQKMNPKLNAKLYNITVPTTSIPWPDSGLRRVSVNSFGFGGSNGHIILDDAYHTLELLALRGLHHTMHLKPSSLINGSTPANHINGNSLNGVLAAPRLLVWSARDEAGLKRMLPPNKEFYDTVISGSPDLLEKLSYTLAERRSVMSWRAYAVAPGMETNEKEGLAISAPVRSSKDSGLVFVFTGQGAQYAKMGMTLISYNVFKKTLERAAEAFGDLGAEWSLFEELNSTERINSPEFSQPLCTALQIALVELLKSFGINPLAVVGHSSGEIAAAYTTGALSLESACKVAYHRGRFAAILQSTNSENPGAMMSVNLPEGQVPSYLQKLSSGDHGITVACINSPTNVTLSGPECSLNSLQELLDDEKIFSRKLKTGVAYHSPYMKTIADDYLQSLGSLDERRDAGNINSILMVSSVTNENVSRSTVSNGQYWVDNLVSPVRFSDALHYLAVVAPKVDKLGKVSTYLEIGPHAALRRPVTDSLAQTLDKKKFQYMSVLSKFESASKSVLDTVGRLFARGYPVSVLAANSQDEYAKEEKPTFLVNLPQYPFDHSQKYWHETRLSEGWRLRGTAPRTILGNRVSDWNPLEPRWRKMLSVEEQPWIADHVVKGAMFFAATGTLMMALEAVREMSQSHKTISGYTVKEATFEKPIVIRPEGRTEVITQLRPLQSAYEKTSVRSEVQIFARLDNHWNQCFNAIIHVEYAEEPTEVDQGREAKDFALSLAQDYEKAVVSCDKPIPKDHFYKFFSDEGFYYGPAFSRAEDVHWDGGDVGIARAEMAPPAQQPYESIVHPGVLDGACQMCYVGPSKGMSIVMSTVVPHKITDAWIAASGWQYPETSHLKTLTRSRLKPGSNGLDSSFTILSDNNTPLCYVKRLILNPVAGGEESTRESGNKLLHSIDWKPQLSLLSPEQLQNYCKAESYSDEEESLAKEFHTRLERTLRAILQIVLPKLKELDDSKLPTHIKLFISWAEKELQHTLTQSDNTIDLLIHELDDLLIEKRPISLISEIARQLLSLTEGAADAYSLLSSIPFSQESLKEALSATYNDKLYRYLELATHKTPNQKILEVGSSAGSITSAILSALAQIEARTGGNAFAEYHYTSADAEALEKAKEKFSAYGDRLTFKSLDLNSDIVGQGFELEQYDVIVVDIALHKAKNLPKTFGFLRKVLKPSGHLILREITATVESLPIRFALSTSADWWKYDEKTGSSLSVLTDVEWDVLLRENGFSGNDLVLRDFRGDAVHQTSIIASTAVNALPPSVNGTKNTRRVILVVNDGDEYQSKVASALIEGPLGKLDYQSSVLSLPEIDRTSISSADYVIILADMGKPLLIDVSAPAFSQMQKWIQQSTNIMWVALPARNSKDEVPHSGIMDGFLRTVRAESTSKKIVSLSLEDAVCVDTHVKDVARVFAAAFETGSSEVEFVVRDGQPFIGRLIEQIDDNRALNSSIAPELVTGPWNSGPPLKLEIATRGSLETLRFVEDTNYSDEMGPYDVEIEAVTWGINFRDLFCALGRLEETELGSDCAGIVTRVGSHVESAKVGDRVCMFTMGCMKQFPRCEEQGIIKIPDNVDFGEACAASTPAMTAWHSLMDIARLRKGEKILIHAASGATGQLAVQIAQMVGAEVFATCGYDYKKQLLVDDYGIPEDHIFYSRNSAFAKGIMRLTNGYGVDVVLNSLVGDSLRSSWDILAPYGRFVEIGKADINANSALPMGGFSANRSYFGVDLRHAFFHRKEIGKELLRKSMELMDQGHIHCPKPLHSYPITGVEDAFRYFQSGKNTGRIVITIDPTTEVEKQVISRRDWSFDANATYVVVGGLGGIGRSILKWMVSKGARNLVVPSKRGAVEGPAMDLVNELSSQGVVITGPKCDASLEESLAQTLDDCKNTMPPIRGCINAAMVINDSVFENMTHDQWRSTLRSKVETSWNLHKLLPADLDFFIFLSSVSGIVGNGGQANYAAGNAFQDAVARHRRSQGQTAMSINVGAMRAVGFIAENEKLKKHFDGSNHLVQIEPDQLLGLLNIYCDAELQRSTQFAPSQPSHITMGIVTPRDLLSRGIEPVESMERPLFAYFSQAQGASQQGSSSANLATLFKQAKDKEERANVVVTSLVKKLARALSMQVEDIDGDKPLYAYGVDSLVAVELRNWIGKEFAADVPIFEMMGGRTIISIGDMVAETSQIAIERQGE